LSAVGFTQRAQRGKEAMVSRGEHDGATGTTKYVCFAVSAAALRPPRETVSGKHAYRKIRIGIGVLLKFTMLKKLTLVA